MFQSTLCKLLLNKITAIVITTKCKASWWQQWRRSKTKGWRWNSLQCEALHPADPQLIVDAGGGQSGHVHVEKLSLRHGKGWGLAQGPSHLGVLILPLIPKEGKGFKGQRDKKRGKEGETERDGGSVSMFSCLLCLPALILNLSRKSSKDKRRQKKRKTEKQKKP